MRLSLLLGLSLTAVLATGCDASRASTPPPSTAAAHAHHAVAQDPTPCKWPKGTCQMIEANDRMHADMAVEWTGDVDVDFLQGMIPHHQGAVEMAKAVLEHGRDPKVRELAQAIIVAQEQEIAMMRQRIVELNQQEGADAPKFLADPAVDEHHGHH